MAELCAWISSELPILYVYQTGISQVQSQMSVKEGHCYLKNFQKVLISDKKKVLKITMSYTFRHAKYLQYSINI